MTPFLVALTGPSGSGKTSLARAIGKTLDGGACALLSLDSYYRDLAHLTDEEREAVNFDRPDALDGERFLADLAELRAGRAIEVPNYDFATHTRALRGRLLHPAPVVLVEGIFALAWPGAASMFDLKVYVDLAADTCLERRLARDADERGRHETEVRRRFEEHVRPSLAVFVEPQRDLCDLVLPGLAALDDMARACLARLPQAGTRPPAQPA